VGLLLVERVVVLWDLRAEVEVGAGALVEQEQGVAVDPKSSQVEAGKDAGAMVDPREGVRGKCLGGVRKEGKWWLKRRDWWSTTEVSSMMPEGARDRRRSARDPLRLLSRSG